MACPDENTIVDFVQGQTQPDVAQKIGAHLDECEACRVLVAATAKSYDVGWSSSRSKASQPSGERGSGAFEAKTDPSISGVDTEPFVRSPDMLGAGQLLDGRFRLRRVLGRGAMGQIFAAYDERLKLQVAIKVILPELAQSRQYLERLHNEIVVARRVSHPNVCRVYDLGKFSGVHFISMELIEGETLEDYLQRRKPSARVAANILNQIVSALDAAHRGGVIHRDLKPANIMIGGQGHVTVMDFGLARDLQREGSEQSKHKNGGRSIVGTPAYWSPEQSRGEPATAASDLYSVGVIACRLLTGRPLHDLGEDPTHSIAKPMRAVIERCLQQDPGKRYASADALSLALQAAEHARPAWSSYAIGAGIGASLIAGAVLVMRSLSPSPGSATLGAAVGSPSVSPAALPSSAGAPARSAAAVAAVGLGTGPAVSPPVALASAPAPGAMPPSPSASAPAPAPGVVGGASPAAVPPASPGSRPSGPHHRHLVSPGDQGAGPPKRIVVFD